MDTSHERNTGYFLFAIVDLKLSVNWILNIVAKIMYRMPSGDLKTPETLIRSFELYKTTTRLSLKAIFDNFC